MLNFDWNQARAFLATAQQGSLSAAAKALGLTQPTIGRQITALENRMGVVLFERSGRSVSLTPAGAELLRHVQGMAEAATAFSLAASGQSTVIEGNITISASDVIAAYVLPDLLPELSSLAPKLNIEIIATNQLSDLRQREADIALRHIRPEQPDLYAKLVREMSARIYAAPKLLDTLGRLESLEDLGRLPFIGYGDRELLSQHMIDYGYPIPPSSIRYNCDSGVVAWQMVRDGLGAGVMAVEVARRCPDVTALFADRDPIRFPLWLVTHRELKTSRKIRTVFDFLSERLSALLADRNPI